jgi:hypothetical protein
MEGLMRSFTHLLQELMPMTCYRVTVVEGVGTEENQIRHVIYWFTADGDLITRHDPCEGT